MSRLSRLMVVPLLVMSVMVVIPQQADATVPGGIGRIVYVSDADHPSGEIYARGFDGSNLTRLTSDTFYDYLPFWSPDGTRIAFGRAVGATNDVFVMDADGSNLANVTNGAGNSTPAGWSPDGSKLLMSSDRSGSSDLWSANPDGSGLQQITNSASNDSGASWSPDGSLIAVERAGDIWIVSADGKNGRPITSGPGLKGSPDWSPDGSKIAFDVMSAGAVQVWVMDANGANAKAITSFGAFGAWSPSWSPEGNKIAFTSDQDGDYDLWTVNPDGSAPAHLTDHSGNERAVSWESVNRAPNAVDDQAAVHRGQSVVISPLSNDSDPDRESLTIADIVRMPAEGTVDIDQSGTVTYSHAGGPIPVARPTDSFDYKIEDARLGSDTATVTVWINPFFDDVPASNVFFDDIIWLASNDVTRGCNPPANTLFCPESFVTRGQMAAFLVRARHYTDAGVGNLFVDDDGSVFEDDIDKLGTEGVTRGCNPPVNDHFCSDSLVTRGQMAAFLARAFRLTDLGQTDLFVDDNGSLFEADIDKLGATGVSRGCNPPDNDRFCPDVYVTREQMAAFIRRAADYIT